MRTRIALEIGLVIGGTLLLAYAVFGAFALLSPTDPWETFVDQVPRLLFGLLGIGLALWVVAVVFGAIKFRDRVPGWRVLTHLAGIVVAMILNAIVLMIAGSISDGELLLGGIAVAAGFVVVVCSVPVILITELLILRGRSPSPGNND